MTASEGTMHACTVNGEDAQFWFDRAQHWQERAGQEYLRGREASDRLWADVTGPCRRDGQQTLRLPRRALGVVSAAHAPVTSPLPCACPVTSHGGAERPS